MITKFIAAAAFSLAMSSLATGAAITQQEKDLIVGKLRQEIGDNYVLSEHVGAINKTLDEAIRSGSMKSVSTHQEMTELLTASLRRFDKHFGVQWRDQKHASAGAGGEDWFAKLGRKNSGFERVEILDGNIGYVDFWGFDNVNDASRTRVKTVMAMVADTDAIIFDLRKNGGGSGDMVRLISSYLLAGKVHLNSFYWKPSNTTTEFWTLEDIDGKRRTDVPLYVLTSAETFSAAEEFAYNLKQLRRATIVGETTKGGANPWRFFELGHGYRAAIPIGQAINPISKANWEHVGVQPDVKATSAQARHVAYRMALAALKESTRNPRQLEEINKKLNE
ncbi:S41 family peptidase [Paucibacter sp. O1-1]|nr:S41 family peptidase [Paucibacter sp. O1-1]MDA3829697.1 S41 family peptidase [Paucibacter sp. O1-1]